MLDAYREAATAALFANADRLEQLTSELGNKRDPVSWAEIALVAVLLVVAPLVAWLAFRRYGGGECSLVSAKPRKLFAELCEAHGLQREERAALESYARRAKLEPEAQIFLSPESFPVQDDASLRATERLVATALHAKLFGPLPLSPGTRVKAPVADGVAGR